MSHVIAHHSAQPRSSENVDLVGFIPRATVEWVSVMICISADADSFSPYGSFGPQEQDEWHLRVDDANIMEVFFTEGFFSDRPQAVVIPLGFPGSGITFTGSQKVTLQHENNAGGGSAQMYAAMTWIGTEA